MIAPAQPSSRTARMSSTVASPPDAMIAPRPRPTSRSRGRGPGPPSRPSRSMAVTSNVVTPASARAARASSAPNAGGSGAPALAERQAVPDVEGDRDPVGAVASRRGPGEGRIAQRGRPDDRARGPGLEDRGDRVLRAQPAGDLDRDPVPDRLDDAADRPRRGPAARSAPRRGRRRAATAPRRRRTTARPRPDRRENAVSRSKSPCSRRTTRPPRRSIAGQDRRSRLSPSRHRVSVLARYNDSTT